MEKQFREMGRFKQQPTDEECKEILRVEERGTLAINGDNGYPYAFPMNFTFDETAGSLLLHSAKNGCKLDAMMRLIRKFDEKFETPEMVEKHLQREAHIVQVLELKIEHMTDKRVVEG